MDIERYSDRTKPRTTVTRDSLSQILVVKRFPQELIGGAQSEQLIENGLWSSKTIFDFALLIFLLHFMMS